MDRGARQATYSLRGCKESDTTERLSLSFHLNNLNALIKGDDEIE